MGMPLEGIKVLEMGAYVVGPAATMMLGDLGADVIKVEPPTGDPHRHIMESRIVPFADFNYLFEAFNRNKRSIVLDGKTEKGKEIIYQLAGQSDVFLSNYRPSAIERLSIDYETLSRVNPRLIYAQITGFGSKGPGKDWPAFDETAFWARSGIMGLLGEPDIPPPPLHGALGDLTTSLSVFGSIVLALYHREHTGIGQKIDSSLLGSGTWVAGWDLQVSLYTGQDIPRNSRKKSANPLYNTYMTKDKRWIQFSMGETDRYWPLLCKALDREDLLKDSRFDSHEKRCSNNELLIIIIDEIMATKSLTEVQNRFYEEGLIWAPVQTMLEVTNDPQLTANEFVVEYDHPETVRFRSVDSPIKLNGCPDKLRKPAPKMGQDTNAVLLELGFTPNEVRELRRKQIVF